MSWWRQLLKFFRLMLRIEEETSESNPSNPSDTTPTEEPIMNGKKYALIIGINKYMIPNADLNGCVNDAEDMWKMLTENYGFEPDNIRMLTDLRATQQNILERLEWLISNLKPGDVALLHYSGHGCFTADTKVSLIDGTEKTMKELTEEYGNGGHFWVYSMDQGVVKPGKAHSPRITKKSRIVTITLDNGEKIRCTPDHLFMLRDGQYKEAQHLESSDSLMPLYRRQSIKEEDGLDGYEMCFVPNEEFRKQLRDRKIIASDTKSYIYTHRLVGVELDMIPDQYKGVLHHNNFNKNDNTPENLSFMDRSAHIKLHKRTPEQKRKDAERLTEWNKTVWPKRMKDEEFRKEFGRKSSEARKNNWKKKSYRKKVSDGLRASFDHDNLDADPRIQSLRQNRHLSHTEEANAKREESASKTRRDPNSKWYKAVHSEERRQQLIEASKKGNHTQWHKNKGIFIEDCKYCVAEKNHKVVSIEWSHEIVDVYDITVDQYHNFALTSGVFVHNSQIRARHDDSSELDDYKTEILCPTDLEWDDPLTDDILAGFFKRIPEGAFLTFISDSCHSGTVDRGLVQPKSNPHEWKPRFIAPPMDIAIRSRGRDLDIHRMGRRAANTRVEGNVCVIDQRHLLLSGCRDDQTSADAFINGKWGGALSQNFLRILSENKDKSWREIHQMVIADLQQQRYSQVPQLTGPENVIDKAPFA